jgi:tetratricopeptide (TPR) repeat protein
MTDTLLDQGISAAITGRRDEARALLSQVVETDDTNEQAWLWLSGLVDDPEDIRTCLENVLHLNPENVKAQHGMAWLEQSHGISRTPVAAAEIDPASDRAGDAPDQVAAPIEKPDPSPALAAAELPRIDDPCPYCGAAAQPDAKRCGACGKSLMAPAEGHEKRSKALTTLGTFWGIGGVFSLLGGALTIVSFIMTMRGGSALLPPPTISRSGANAAAIYSKVLMASMYGQILGAVGYGIFQLVIARGLFRRRRWAWIVSAVLQGLQLLVALGIVLFFATMMRMLIASLPGGNSRSGSPLGTVIFVLVLLLMFAPQIVSMLLLFFSYGDVFAPMKRISVHVSVAKPAQHYNNGLDYKNRGMWYMAAQEWAAAVRDAPHEPNFLHALGLAFAQLGQFDRARSTLDFALQVAPADAGLAESRTLVDRMEKRGGRW